MYQGEKKVGLLTAPWSNAQRALGRSFADGPAFDGLGEKLCINVDT